MIHKRQMSPRLGWPSVLRVVGAAALATGSAVSSSDLFDRGRKPEVLLITLTFFLLVGCVWLIIDETVIRVQRALDLANDRAEKRRACAS